MVNPCISFVLSADRRPEDLKIYKKNNVFVTNLSICGTMSFI